MSTETLMDTMVAENDFCSICLRNKSEVKLDPISDKMYHMFFVGLVKCVESKMADRNICIWCSRRVDNTLKLVETARLAGRILAGITQIGKSRCQVISCNLMPDTELDVSVKLEQLDNSSGDEMSVCLEDVINEVESDGKDPIGLERHDFLALRLESENEDQLKSKLDITKKSSGHNETRRRSISKLNAVTKKKMKEMTSSKTFYIEISKLEPVDTGGVQSSVNEKPGFKKQALKNRLQESEANIEIEDTNSRNTQTYSSTDAPKHIRLLQLTEAQRLSELEERRQEARYRNASFRCEPCAIGFAFRSTYETHMERHSESFGSHKCSTCGVYVKKVSSYRQHCRNHYARHACTVCGFTSPDRHAVLTHYLSRHTKQRHKCEHCASEFSKASGLKLHMKTVHDAERPLFPCPRCSQVLSSRFSYNLHMAQHNRSERSGMPCPHRCDACSRTFRTASHLRQHRATHSKEKAFFCQRCGDGFKSPWTLHTHVKRKHSDACFECDYCRKTFSVKSDLKEHITWTHLGRGFNCQFCSKVLRSSFLLGRHVKQKHEGWAEPRDKLCEVCGKGFSHNNILKIHRRIHSAERPYRCASCPAAFKQRSTLKTHRRLVHKIND